MQRPRMFIGLLPRFVQYTLAWNEPTNRCRVVEAAPNCLVGHFGDVFDGFVFGCTVGDPIMRPVACEYSE